VIITDGGGNSANHSRMASVANSRSNSFEMNTTEQQSKSMAGVNSNRNKGGTGMVFTPATGNAGKFGFQMAITLYWWCLISCGVVH